ncbi:hypothetical protein BDN67DRAFT_1013030 [Paxillus ammoniavirescens]|nr:hypothetical protein BDN67DRAFT_1013030 [Paxillus ammoniavirescens]
MSDRVEERQSRRKEARDDEVGQDVDKTLNKEEEGQWRDRVQLTAMNANENGQYPSQDKGDLPPEPPPFPHHPALPPPLPIHPERLDNIDTARTETKEPPSVRLEGERIRVTSRHVKTDDVEMEDDDHVEEDPDNQNLPRNPVGTTDGDEHRPNGPTEPPDEKEGERGVDGELKVEMRVEMVENVKSRESSQVDQPGGRGVEETKLREVEDKLGGTDEDNSCQQDGRMNDMGDQTSSASCDSQRVETSALAEDKVGQHRDSTRNVSMDAPGPPTPSKKYSKRPAYHVNPPRHRG